MASSVKDFVLFYDIRSLKLIIPTIIVVCIVMQLTRKLIYEPIWRLVREPIRQLIPVISRRREEPNAAPARTVVATEPRPDEDIDDDDSEAEVKHVKFAYEKPTVEMMREQSFAFYMNANARRSLRFFSREPVPKDVIHNIIKAAGTSPSGAHTEPWTFVAVSNSRVRNSIRTIVEREEETNYRRRMGEQWTNDVKPFKTDWHKEYLEDAPWLICVFRQDYSVLANGRRKVHYYKEISIGIACGILITAIQFAGLVTLTSTPHCCGSALRTLLGRPENEKLVLLLPVGYPAEDATVPALTRKELEEILVEIE